MSARMDLIGSSSESPRTQGFSFWKQGWRSGGRPFLGPTRSGQHGGGGSARRHGCAYSFNYPQAWLGGKGMAITRRQFVTRLGALAAAVGMSQMEISKISDAFAGNNPTLG